MMTSINYQLELARDSLARALEEVELGVVDALMVGGTCGRGFWCELYLDREQVASGRGVTLRDAVTRANSQLLDPSIADEDREC